MFTYASPLFSPARNVVSVSPPPNANVLRSNVASKVPDVAAGNAENGTTTPAATPGAAQQWICAAAATPPINPLKTSCTARSFPVRVSNADPVAVDALGGVSFDPSRTAVYVIVSAKHRAPRPLVRSSALNVIHRFSNIVFLLASS